MGKDNRSGLGYVPSMYEHGESSNSSSRTIVFVKGAGVDSVTKTENSPMKTVQRSKLVYEQTLKTSSSGFSPPKNHSSAKMAQGAWYFDSGCSRHMTGSKEHLIYYSEQKNGHVTYGGGAKGRIVGKGTLNVDGLPMLHNFLHVEGLDSNLISISQLCDDDLHVRFNKNNCEVFNDENVCVMTGTRSADNCYLVGDSNDCRSAKVSNLDLWHQKLGHVSFKTLKNLCKYEAVRGMPNLCSDNAYICRSCQKGKQTRVAHPVLQHFGKTRCLELLHMDLMGPMDVESLGGLTGKYKEDDIEGLLDSSEPSTSIGVEVSVETNEATPCTTPPIKRSETMENENDDDDGVIHNERRDIPSKIQKDHPSSQIIGEIHEEVQKRKKEKVDYRKMIGLVCMNSTFAQVSHSCFVSSIEPKNVNEALKDEFWVNAMHEELEQFVRNDVWNLVPRPSNVNVIGSKWIFKNKTDESSNIIRNKARLVAQRYTQVEGVDFDETFAHVARMDSVRLLLAVACHMRIKLYQMDVKSAFLNGILNEEGYVCQPKGFEDPHHMDHVYKLKKALYGLKQAPRA
ncbi:uncharacterized protein [Primulina eburnea]|uniref:uncharacterized protein n=1 Tax=Primulina eburnea TaxID=1245227 RepID=UPI003C6C0490